MARSPVALGIVLGLVVGVAGAAAIATTSSTRETSPSSALPTSPGGAQSDRLGSDPAPGSIERLAAAFGMSGAVETDAGGWVVHDGRRLLRVQRTAGVPWFFSAPDPSCVVVPDGPPPGEPLQTVPPSGPTECPEETPPGDVTPKDAALALGTGTLARAGLGPSTPPVIVDQPGGWYIEAAPLVGGKPDAGLPWTISIGPGGAVAAASGYLATPGRS